MAANKPESVFDDAWAADLESVAAIMEEEVTINGVLVRGVADVAQKTDELVVGGKADRVTLDIYLRPEVCDLCNPKKGSIVEVQGRKGRITSFEYLGGGGVRLLVTSENSRTERLF